MKSIKEKIIKAKGFEDLSDFLSSGDDAEAFAGIVKAIESRRERRPVYQLEDPDWLALNEQRKEREASAKSYSQTPTDATTEPDLQQPQETESALLRTPLASSASPNPDLLRAPLGPANDMRIPLPACVSGKDADTPTPTPQPLSREVSALRL